MQCLDGFRAVFIVANCCKIKNHYNARNKNQNLIYSTYYNEYVRVLTVYLNNYQNIARLKFLTQFQKIFKKKITLLNPNLKVS